MSMFRDTPVRRNIEKYRTLIFPTKHMVYIKITKSFDGLIKGCTDIIKCKCNR